MSIMEITKLTLSPVRNFEWQVRFDDRMRRSGVVLLEDALRVRDSMSRPKNRTVAAYLMRAIRNGCGCDTWTMPIYDKEICRVAAFINVYQHQLWTHRKDEAADRHTLLCDLFAPPWVYDTPDYKSFVRLYEAERDGKPMEQEPPAAPQSIAEQPTATTAVETAVEPHEYAGMTFREQEHYERWVRPLYVNKRCACGAEVCMCARKPAT